MTLEPTVRTTCGATRVTARRYLRSVWMDEMVEAIAMVGRSSYGRAVFEIIGTTYYVQLCLDYEPDLDAGQRWLVVEARSNYYLYDEAERLTAEQEAAFVQLGWQAPGSMCDHRCGCDGAHGNWFRYATIDGIDESGAPLAAVALAAFGVYGAGENVEVNVAYDCSAGRSGTPYCD